MAASTVSDNLVSSLISSKVSISRPPYLCDTSSYRFASDLSLNNRNVDASFRTTTNSNVRKRAQSATTRNKSDILKPRRVSSAKERPTTYVYQKQLALCEPVSNGNDVSRPVRRPSSASKPAKQLRHNNGTSYTRPKSSKLMEAKANKHSSIPQALDSLSPYITYEPPDYLDHPALRGSIVLLPGVYNAHTLPTLPALHSTEEDYPYTHLIPADYTHKPKKYSHPYYERVKQIKGWTCNHSGREVRVTSLTGRTIHRFTLDKQRNKTAVRDEIVELERLMKGLSTEWGKSTVALYQNEINDLQKMVKETLSMTSLPETPPATPDPTGLRKFCREYDTALQALEARHHHCMRELKELQEIDELYERAKQLEGLS